MHSSILALLPIIAKALLQTIVLHLTRIVLAALTCHEPLLSLLALDRQLSPELDLARAALGQLVDLVLGDGRAALLLVLAGCGWAGPGDDVGVL